MPPQEATLDTGYLPRVVADPLPELPEGPPSRASRPAHPLPEVPDRIARAIVHRRTPGGADRGEIELKLPSERSFAVEYEVAYTTVRHAMAVLRDRGIVLTVHGRGTFVTPREG